MELKCTQKIKPKLRNFYVLTNSVSQKIHYCGGKKYQHDSDEKFCYAMEYIKWTNSTIR